MNASEAALLLNLIPEMTLSRFRHLQNRFGELPRVFSAAPGELEGIEEISGTLVSALLRAGRESAERLEEEMELARREKAAVVTFDRPEYPAILRTIADPPPVLYCKGDLKIFEKWSVALVGSRKPTPYGEATAETLAAELASAGIVTVSGLARGIDTAVHRASLAAGGGTIAVLGSGLARIYPPENKRLAESVSEAGLLVSEFPMRTPPFAGNFPRRNRVIAGLSAGTVVVEADEKSGALITARLAAEQGKDVFAVPGPVTSRMSRGPHALIRQGAKLVERSQDIVEEIAGLKERFDFRRPSAPAKEAENVLNPQETELLEKIRLEPVHIDRLSGQSPLSSGELSHILLTLELKGKIRALPGKRYVRN